MWRLRRRPSEPGGGRGYRIWAGPRGAVRYAAGIWSGLRAGRGEHAGVRVQSLVSEPDMRAP